MRIAEAKMRTLEMQQQKKDENKAPTTFVNEILKGVTAIVGESQSDSKQKLQIQKPLVPRPPKKEVHVRFYDSSDLRLFVKNLRPETTTETLKNYFSRWGPIQDIYLRKPTQLFDGTCCSMGFITFSSFYNESPLNAYIHVIDGMSVPIFKVQVQPNRKFEVVENSHTLMLSGAISETTDMELIEYFNRYGNIINLIRKRDYENPGKFQRFAFIRFNEISAVNKALQQETHVIKGQSVDIRRAKDLK